MTSALDSAMRRAGADLARGLIGLATAAKRIEEAFNAYEAERCPDCEGAWEEPMGDDCGRPWYHADEWAADCEHDWMLRPESDTYECLACGSER